MISRLPSKKFWKIYKTLPDDLKEVLASEKLGEEVFDICERNGIAEKAEEVLDCTSLVLLGLLPLENFKTVLEKELKIQADTAKRIGQEIFRLVFFPVKLSLENLYKESAIGENISLEIAQKEKFRKDIYREPIE